MAILMHHSPSYIDLRIPSSLERYALHAWHSFRRMNSAGCLHKGRYRGELEQCNLGISTLLKAFKAYKQTQLFGKLTLDLGQRSHAVGQR